MTRFATIICIAVAVTPTLRAQATSPAGWWDDVFQERPVELSRVISQPDRYREMPISFVIQFRQLVRHDQAFFTKYDPETWQSIAAWSDDAPLWEKRAFETDFRRLFVRRGSDEAKVFAQATPYRRFRVSGVVTHVIKGQPWIELTGLTEVPGQLSEASLVHLVKGLMLRDLRRFESAAREFQASDAETLPTQVRLLCMREEALAILNAGRPAAAERRLTAALALAPEDAATSAALAHVRISVSRSREDVPAGAVDRATGADSRPAESIITPRKE